MKRALLLLLLVLPAVGSAQGRNVGLEWACSLDDKTDAMALCVSAPEPGMRRYITDITATSTTTTPGLFNLIHGKSVATGGSADCGTDPIELFPIATGLMRFAFPSNASRPLVFSANASNIVPSGRDLCVTVDAAASLTIQLSGYVAP